MKRTEAKNIIKKFVSENKGKNILFNTLNDNNKIAYILTKSFIYYNNFLNTDEALKRAIKNMEVHKTDNFKIFTDNINESITISKN